MSLNATLDVNGRIIGTITMQRITNTGRPVLDPDAESVYKVCQYNEYGTLTESTSVKHRYGDGADHLLLASLSALLL